MKILVCHKCKYYPTFKSFVVDNNLLVKAVDKEVAPILKASDDIFYNLTHHGELTCEGCGIKVSAKSRGSLVNKEDLIKEWNSLNESWDNGAGRTIQ